MNTILAFQFASMMAVGLPGEDETPAETTATRPSHPAYDPRPRLSASVDADSTTQYLGLLRNSAIRLAEEMDALLALDVEDASVSGVAQTVLAGGLQFLEGIEREWNDMQGRRFNVDDSERSRIRQRAMLGFYATDEKSLLLSQALSVLIRGVENLYSGREDEASDLRPTAEKMAEGSVLFDLREAFLRRREALDEVLEARARLDFHEQFVGHLGRLDVPDDWRAEAWRYLAEAQNRLARLVGGALNGQTQSPLQEGLAFHVALQRVVFLDEFIGQLETQEGAQFAARSLYGRMQVEYLEELYSWMREILSRSRAEWEGADEEIFHDFMEVLDRLRGIAARELALFPVMGRKDRERLEARILALDQERDALGKAMRGDFELSSPPTPVEAGPLPGARPVVFEQVLLRYWPGGYPDLFFDFRAYLTGQGIAFGTDLESSLAVIRRHLPNFIRSSETMVIPEDFEAALGTALALWEASMHTETPGSAGVPLVASPVIVPGGAAATNAAGVGQAATVSPAVK